MPKKILSIIFIMAYVVLLCSCKEGGSYNGWNGSLFAGSSTIYNKKLALVAAELSQKSENGPTEIAELFDLYNITKYKNYSYSSDGAFSIAHGELTINGEITTIFIVTARGTKTGNEMIGDLFKGGEVEFLNTKVWHNVYDFYNGISDGINEYRELYPELETAPKMKVLITGHSLGGAAANMVGAKITSDVKNGSFWGKVSSMDDVYVYTFGAIKVLTDDNIDNNISDGFENIHNIYNYYDSYGPNGNLWYTNVSSPNAKFGHTEMLEYRVDENPFYPLSSNCHIIETYIEAIKANNIELHCTQKSVVSATSQQMENSATSQQIESSVLPQQSESFTTSQQPESSALPPQTSEVTASSADDFSIIGTWKNVGSGTFGQAQAGAVVIFDGTYCNFYSPKDTYYFWQDDGDWELDCKNMLWGDVLSFKVEIVDDNNIKIYFGSICVELKRIE